METMETLHKMGIEKLWSLTFAMMLLTPLAVARAADSPDPLMADLSITNTTMPNPATVQENLTYGMNVINNGSSVATSVQVIDTLPPGVTLVSASFNFIGGASTPCTGTTTITCNIGTMGVGRLQGAAVLIIVRPQGVGTLSHTATVSANEEDPDLSNNTATAVTAVEPQVPDPIAEDPDLLVKTVVSGLSQPTGMVFLGDNDFLVLEKSTGMVKRVVNGIVQSTVLDLAVNNFSERGLLGIALHPSFASNGFVYIRWTCRGPSEGEDCADLFGDDTANPAEVPLLGNRVDRFIWNGTTLTFDMNLIRLHAFQADVGQPQQGNHNGGKILFGPDGKLYIFMGDNGRRGWLQNITEGFGPDGMDDQFGGPEPDNAHLTGVVLRLNDDGTAPEDNPFFNVQASDLPEDLQPRATPEVIANIQKVFSYGHRNGFGMAFDPATGVLWESENGDDSGTEINRIDAGSNGGWSQIMGGLDHIADYKAIETSPVYFGLQQIRWPPTLIADSPQEALDRLFMLPGAFYSDPLLSWKFEVAPASFGFVIGQGLGPEYDGSMIVGGARNFLLDGHLFRLKLTEDRMDLDLSDDPRLADRVVPDIDKWDLTGSESLLFGRGFGITTDIQTGPNGHLFVVSLSKGTVYEILQRP
jgi:uncharacterized repeat protein (TIGR01451 family)